MIKNFPTREENYSQWYNDLVIRADLAENSGVSGCMVIKPYGFAILEKMQGVLDRMFKDTGHSNAYFPLFIPKSFFSREASHVEGFAKECAVVTHYRLKNSPDNKGVIVDEEARLEEELIIRPTSETIIWDTYRNWIQSYRDLPLLINQWANVVRWEMRTRLFLRTTEFLWQEGHTAHATEEEALAETNTILNLYADFAESWMALPVIKGVKTESERFAGAVDTYAIEALMQDGKALQSGTSHFLGQNFAKAFDVKFLTKENQLDYVWATSWGVSTRLMGALIMAHSDDHGLVLPPKLAPIQVVAIPVFKTVEQLKSISAVLEPVIKELESIGISVKYDSRDTCTPGWKFSEYEFKGVPIRLTLGPRDLEHGTIELARRDTLTKSIIPLNSVIVAVRQILDDIQKNLYSRCLQFREEHTFRVDRWEDFVDILERKGGFLYAHWDGTSETEEKIKEATKATVRIIPLNNPPEMGKCIFTGRPSNQRVLFARAY